MDSVRGIVHCCIESLNGVRSSVGVVSVLVLLLIVIAMKSLFGNVFGRMDCVVGWSVIYMWHYLRLEVILVLLGSWSSSFSQRNEKFGWQCPWGNSLWESSAAIFRS